MKRNCSVYRNVNKEQTECKIISAVKRDFYQIGKTPSQRCVKCHEFPLQFNSLISLHKRLFRLSEKIQLISRL